MVGGMTRETTLVVAELKNLAKMQRQRAKPVLDRPRHVAPSEQLRRFVAGEERWRVDEGLVTPQEYFEYEKEMLQRLAASGGL